MRLTRTDPEANLARYYRMQIVRGLFGNWGLVREWGRIGTPGRVRTHTLADAGAEGEIGPVLDDEKPSASQVLAAVKSGLGVMPSYEVILTQEEMRSVALYVAAASGGALDLPAAE